MTGKSYLLTITSSEFNFRPTLKLEKYKRMRPIWASYYEPESAQSCLLMNIDGVENSGLIQLNNSNDKNTTGFANTNRFALCVPIREKAFTVHNFQEYQDTWFPLSPSNMNFTFNSFYSTESVANHPLTDVDINVANPILLYVTFE